MAGIDPNSIQVTGTSSSSSSSTSSSTSSVTRSGMAGLREPEPVPAAPAEPPGDPDAPMSARAFDDLFALIKRTGSQDQQLRIMRARTEGKRFTVAQLARIIGIIAFEDDRMETFRIFVPRLVDRDGIEAAISVIEYDDEQERARRLVQSL